MNPDGIYANGGQYNVYAGYKANFIDMVTFEEPMAIPAFKPLVAKEPKEVKLNLKKKHLTKNQRDALHKPEDDGILGTESFDLKDILSLV